MLFTILRCFCFQNHTNAGAASLLFDDSTSRHLSQDMDDRGMETEEARVKHEVDYYVNLLTDPTTLQQWRQDARHLRERDIQEEQVEVLRQNVTFTDCVFEGNSYGDREIATNYGAIGVEARDNDCVVERCIFRFNNFGDITQVVCDVWHGCILAGRQKRSLPRRCLSLY